MALKSSFRLLTGDRGRDISVGTVLGIAWSPIVTVFMFLLLSLWLPPDVDHLIIARWQTATFCSAVFLGLVVTAALRRHFPFLAWPFAILTLISACLYAQSVGMSD